MVAQMIKSISSSLTLACSIARRAASTARSDVHCQSAAMRRSLMPERDTIHSSVVSTSFSRSAFVSMRSGTYEPVPTMCTGLRSRFNRGLRKCDLLDFVMELPGFLNEMLVKLAFNKLGGHANGILGRIRRAGAVGLDADAVNAQQDGAAVLVGISLALERLERTGGEQRAKHPQGVLLEFLFQPIAHQPRRALTRLQHCIPDERVGHNHVGAVREQVMAIDVADKIQVRLLE